ncbi:MAG: Gfo/Idh/MocA family protein [Thermoguttaceae bacterium]|jgi:predicted dehydrogenase
MRRRDFLKSAAAAAGVLCCPAICRSSVLGANQAIRVGVIGLGGRGWGEHVPRNQRQEGVEVVALADPDRRLLGSRAEAFAKAYGRPVDQYDDMRRIFDRDDVDAISNATQNYWHALSTIWACQAGKHVYVEKPLSHYIWEGRQMVNAARKYNRIVQCGTQRRSQKGVIDAIAWLKAGNLGPIRCVTAFANKARLPIGKLDKPLEIPKELNYDLWCGPAQMLPIYRPNLQYDCSFDWNTGDGESCNQGVHEVDIARWALGEDKLPRRVISVGGRFNADDAANVPNTQVIYYDFPAAPLIYEVHNLPTAKRHMATPEAFRANMPDFRGVRTGVAIDCEGGYLSIPDCVAYDKGGKKIASFSGGEDHFENFIGAVRSGRREDLRAEVLEGHVSTSVTHLGNISYRVGNRATAAEIRRAIGGVAPLGAAFDRLLEHLAAHEIDVDKPTVTLGQWLAIDADHERVLDHEKANALVKGTYREPYVVPEIS